MSSGMGVAADVKDVFEELKNKKTLQFVVFHIINATKKKGSLDPQEIQVLSKEAAGPSLVDAEASEKDKAWKKTHQEFIDAISKDNCRYVVLDFKFMTSEGSERAKIIFIHWSPDTVGVKEKMLYASSKDALKAVLADGIAVEVQANDISDLGYDEIVDRLKSSMARS